MTTENKYKTKPRVTDDYLPSKAEKWNELSPAVEQAYRRGFTQGFAQAVQAVEDGMTLESIKRFVYGRLWRWRYASRMRCSFPPELKITRAIK